MWNFVFVLIQVWIYLMTATIYGHFQLWIITIYNFDVSRLEIVLFSLEDATIDARKALELLGRILKKLVVEGILFIQDIAREIKDGRT